MTAHGDEKVVEEPATLLHFADHARTLLEVVPIADNDG